MENLESLYKIIETSIELNNQRYEIVKDEIENIIINKVKDEHQIEKYLDEMLDILTLNETKDSLLTFRRLCKYYFSINPSATVDYINLYKEQNDPEETKFGNKYDKNLDNEER